MKNEFIQTKPNGFSMIEVLLSSAIIVIVVTGFAGAFIYGSESSALAGQRARVAYLVEEGLEAARSIKNANFANLSNGNKGIGVSGGIYTFSGASDTTESFFNRVVSVANVSSQRKSLTSTVTWNQNLQRTGSAVLETRFTNWRRNFGAWSSASVESVIDLVGNANANGVAIYKTLTNTYAVIVRDNSADPELYIYDITNPASPTLTATLQDAASLFDIVISGNYAYIASSDNSRELIIINLSIPSSPTIVGSFNAAGNSDANAVAISGSTVFIGRSSSTDPEIYSISVSNPISPTQLGSLNTTDTINELALGQSNQYLYASSIDNNGELVVVSVSNPSSLSITSAYNVAGNFDGVAVAAFSTYALLGRASGEVDVVQLSTPSVPSLISSSLTLANQVNDFFMMVGDLYSVAGIGTGAAAVQMVDLSNLSSPSSIVSVASTSNVNGVVYDFDLNRVIAVSSGNPSEIYIIKPN